MASNLIKLTETRIGDNNALARFVNEAKAVANVIFPETLPFSNKYSKLGAEIVTVDVKNEKHVYKNESGSYCLHLSKLNEIAKAAKIRTIGSRILERKTDETGRVTFISHEVTVQYRTVSGEMITESYTGKYDYYNDIATKSQKQADGRRKHAEALAESNALTRAFNKVLPQLPQGFKETELNKPFLIPFVEEDKDALLAEFSPEEQAEIKKELARRKLGIIGDIYAGTSSPKQIQQNPPSHSASAPLNNVPADVDNTKPQYDDAKVVDDDIDAQAETWRHAEQKDRTEKILNLIKIKNYVHPKGTVITAALIEKSPIDRQIATLKGLLEMPDAEEETL